MTENQPTPTPANATVAVREATPLTVEQALILSAYTRTLCVERFSDFHEYVEKVMGRPVWTHEMGNKEFVERLGEKVKPQFMALIPAALSAPASPAQGSLEAACAYYRQGLEMIVKTDHADLASLHYHAQRILDTCDDGNLLLVRFRHQVQRAEKAEAEVARLTAPASPAPVDGERETLQLIDERDEAEEAVSKAYEIVTGRSPEWSNAFGYGHALEEIEECVQSLKDAAKSPAPVANLDGLREELVMARSVLTNVVEMAGDRMGVMARNRLNALNEGLGDVMNVYALAPQSPAAPGTEAKS